VRYSAAETVRRLGEGVPVLDIPGLDVVATSYGVEAQEAHSTDDVTKLVDAGIADRERPTLINARITPIEK
jgi:benzoylformate decarboxylase